MLPRPSSSPSSQPSDSSSSAEEAARETPSDGAAPATPTGLGGLAGESGLAGEAASRPDLLAAVEPESVGRPMNILLIEDSVLEARLTMGVLRKGSIPHKLNWLRNGTKGIAYLKRGGQYANAKRPDLVLLDLRLPGVDGADVLRMIREDDDLSSLPVVVMTSSTNADDQRRAEELDVQAYLTKPVDLEKFLAVVAELKDYWQADMVLPQR